MFGLNELFFSDKLENTFSENLPEKSIQTGMAHAGHSRKICKALLLTDIFSDMGCQFDDSGFG